jgi:hypothetical protein
MSISDAVYRIFGYMDIYHYVIDADIDAVYVHIYSITEPKLLPAWLNQAERYYLYLSISCHLSKAKDLENDAVFSELIMKEGPQECTYSSTPSPSLSGI